MATTGSILLLAALSFEMSSTNAADRPPLFSAEDRSGVSSEVTAEGCTIERFTVHSPSMGREIKAAVVLPPGYQQNSTRTYPILYTLHGSHAPYDTFAQMLPLRRALHDRPMIVTCFDADGASMYVDSLNLLKTGRSGGETAPVKSLFDTFFRQEFLPCIDRNYRVNVTQRMLTGFSMGGWGALHYLLEQPRDFTSVSALSGWFPEWNAGEHTGLMAPVLGTFADNAARYHDLDLYRQIVRQQSAGSKLPPILLCCGTEDRLLGDSRTLHAFLASRGIPCELRESPGAHDWAYWQGISADLVDFHWRSVPSTGE